MPFCETCAKYWAPSAANADGTCPSCGRALEKPRAIHRPGEVSAPVATAAASEPAKEKLKAPWHFWLLVGALAVYLAFRLFQFVVWLMTGVWQ